MMMLVAGLLLFFAAHLIPTEPELRRGLTLRFGETSYKVGFSLLSLLGLVLIVAGFGALQAHPGKNPVLWEPPLWMRHIAFALMWPAFVLLAAAYIPSHIHTYARHPMLVAIKLWALVHLLANGDLASLLLFGGFLAYAGYDRISVKRRGALGPLGARKGGFSGDVLALAVGTALYVFMLFWGHKWLTGVPLLPA